MMLKLNVSKKYSDVGLDLSINGNSNNDLSGLVSEANG